MKRMNLVKSTSCVMMGLLAATGVAYAQEVTHQAPPAASARNPAETYEKLLRDADALLKDGKPDRAYKLLEPHEFQYAGKTRFDYMIGIAALDSGKPDMATLALERVLAINPDHAGARLDIARAYYQLGDFPRAKTEFTAALKRNPSAATRTNIQKYLDAIAAKTDEKRTRYSGYVEAGIGRDSNVNSSTSESQVFVDSFASTITLDPVNVKTADNYYAAAAGGEINHGLSSHWGLYAGADLRKRGNNTHTQFDSFNSDVRAGVVYETSANRLRVGAIGSQYDLGGTRNSNTTGLKAELRHVFSPSNQLNALFQSAQFRYIEPYLQPNDVDQQVLGLGWLHVLADGKSSLSGSIHYGTENDVAPIIVVIDPVHGNITANPSGGRNDGSRIFKGLRIGGQTTLDEITTLFASAGIQTSDYDKVNYRFLRLREDRLYDLKLGANWHWDKLWALRPQLNYSRNDSNIAIYGYDRMDIALTVRRDFR
jgi:tetratricopeptide (TPR) repeat protein